MKAWPFVAVLVLAYFYKVGWSTIVTRNNAVAQAACCPELVEGPAPAAPVESTSPRERWAYDLASRLGNTAPTAETIAFLVEWSIAEDGGDGAMARFNPLNTTDSGGAIFTINGDGVRGFPDYETGMQATVRTLTNGRYDEVVAGLQANDPSRALAGLIASPWASSHYNGGRDWPHYTMSPAATGEEETRAALVSYALSLQGIPYVSGGRSEHGGDCSGTMQHIYLTITGIDIGDTTFSQLPRLTPIDASQAQPGDLWYGQYPDDQHTGMLADVNGDGRWDLINNGGLRGDLHVDYDFLSQPYFAEHTIGYRRAL